MNPDHYPMVSSVFRTEAWVQAWIDTWGKDPRITLIDLGGRQHPLEQVYLIKHRIKKVLPIKALCLAGVGYGSMSTPRAEYNDVDALITMAGGVKGFQKLISHLDWQQFVIADVLSDSATQRDIYDLLREKNWSLHIAKKEFTYSIPHMDFESYVKQLGPNTRLAYFNRRDRLSKEGQISLTNYSLQELPLFFDQLNQFHITRWGRPCYSADSRMFLENFFNRLRAAGGDFIAQSLQIEGRVVSVLLDVCWQKARLNFQSGYFENVFPKISLGALHFGYAIEEAMKQGLDYDFMAGMGKISNYKERVATHTSLLQTQIIEQGVVRKIRQLVRQRQDSSGVPN